MSFNIKRFFEKAIKEEIKTQISINNNNKILIQNKNLLGKNTTQFIDVFLLYLIQTNSEYKSHKNPEQEWFIKRINKIKNRLNNSNIKIVIDISTGNINIELDKSIYNFDINRANEKRIKNLKRTRAEIEAINVKYDDELGRIKAFNLHNINILINEAINKSIIKAENNSKINENNYMNIGETIEKLYIFAISLIISKYVF